MLTFPLKLSAYRLPIDSMTRTVLPPNFVYLNEHASFIKNIFPGIRFCLFSSFMVPYKCIYLVETPRKVESCKGIENSGREFELSESDDDKKNERCTKIGRSNKGKVPWNKGLKHSEETREKIRQRTKEALKDPKVRKKMSECPRTLSDQTKLRIRASLTKLWGERLKWKKSREKFIDSWRHSIALSAKIGGSDQQKLNWDSYEKIKKEIALARLHEAEEIAKAKEMARLRAERAAQLREEKMAGRAQRRREREEKAKIRGEKVTRKRKSKEEKEKLAEFEEVKLKERLMKIHKKKSTIHQVSDQGERSWEKFDLDFVKGEELQKEMTLADQIRLAKNRRAEQQSIDLL